MGRTAGDALEDTPDPGTSVLIAGPPMTGKRELLYELLAGDRGADRGTAIVTTRKTADTVRTEYADHHPDLPDRRSFVVDCVSRQHGRGRGGDERTRYVNHPGDLTEIGIRLTGFMRQLHDDSAVDGAGVGMHTLSTTLMYTDLSRVFQFVHVLTGRIESSGFVGAFVLDTPSAGNAEQILSGAFDAKLEVREADDAAGTRQVRGRGTDVAPRRWTAF
jgi:KaiC/GvpD/RAD55 family RecA-like ATPase